MYILGISCYFHDSSAALLDDGQIISAAQEERFTRIKHDTSFPKKSIDFCLKSQGISIQDIDYIGFYEKPLQKFERILYQHITSYPQSIFTFLSSVPSWFSQKLRMIPTIRKELGYKGPVLFIDHHMAHAASSFLVSPFKEAAILTVDGVGEWTTTSVGYGKNNDIRLAKEIRFPHSLGLLYSTVTAYLGMSVNNSEYKVMGLAAYGKMDRKTNEYYQKLLTIIDIKKDGSYHLKMDYFSYLYQGKMPGDKLCTLLGGPIKKPSDEMTQRHKDIAAAVQLITEDVLLLILKDLHGTTKTPNLVIGGGVGLNSVFNGKILANSKFKNVWIPPDPGDGGTSIGAATFIYHSLLGHQRNNVFTNPYLGPKYSLEYVRDFLNSRKIKYHQFNNSSDLLGETTKLLVKDNVIGWFQGGMEWGPRALGARSILSNPQNPNMQNILNLKVKHREKFRPFAPVVCCDDVNKYFLADKPLPKLADYMLAVYPIKKNWHGMLPAVTHIDGSGRLQTISREQNPLYYDLIKSFGKKMKIPILVNTSFNIRGEPIVCTPQDAYRCMMGTGIDYLVMDKFLIKRDDNLKDAWDSEKIAND